LLQAVLQINDVLKGKSIPGSETTWLKGSEMTWGEMFFFSPMSALIVCCCVLLAVLIPVALVWAALQINAVLRGRSILGCGTTCVSIFGVLILIGIFFGPILQMIVSCVFLAMFTIFVVVLRAVLTLVAWLWDDVTNLCGRRRAELDLRRVQTELERSEFDQTMCPICLEQFATSAHAGCTILSCRHKFHGACIESWVDQQTNCPLCRADIEGPIAPEDETRPQDFQPRLRFYLSRLEHRHPLYFTTSDSSNHLLTLGRNDGYEKNLQSFYESVMSQSSGSSGSSGCSGGGGGFGGGGGGGGGW